jgi:nitrite reductase/ring-hydroxylating ferredoxin subunit
MSRIQFFSQLTNGKRSFQLRDGTVTAKTLTLMSTIVDPVVVDTRDGGVVGDVERHPYVAGVAYEVRKREQSAAERESAAAWTAVGTLDWLRAGGALQRRRVGVHGRDVLVWYDSKSGAVGAIDGVCYHFGAPLDSAPIELVSGHACLVCPWHRYPLALDTGESFVQPGGASKGVKQRVHECRVDDAGTVLVRLGREPAEVASDHYATMGLFSVATQGTASNLHSTATTTTTTRANDTDDGGGDESLVRTGIVTQRRQFLEPTLWLLQLEWNDKALALPLARHLDLEHESLPTRSYTPVSSRAGAVELLVRDCGPTSHHLTQLAPGSAVRVRAPLGRYVSEPDVVRAAFIANGTGVSPLLAVLRSRAFDSAGLVHAQRADWPAAALAPLPSNLALLQCVTAPQRIDAPLLTRLLTATRAQRVYLCGTDAFCEAMVELLTTRLHVKRDEIFQF